MQRVGVAQITPGGGLAVDASALRTRAERAVRRARRAGTPVLLGFTTRVRRGRRPERRRVRLAGRGRGLVLLRAAGPRRVGARRARHGRPPARASGADRFKRVASDWRELTAGAVADPPDGPPGAGLVALGGFAFAPEGGHAPHWGGFEAGDLIVPEVALARRGDDVRLTLAALAAPDDVAGGARRRGSTPAPPHCGWRRCRCSTRRPAGRFRDRLGRAARALRGRGRPRRRAHPAPAPSRRSCSRARSPSRRRRRTTPPRSSASCARALSPVTCSAPAAATRRSSPPRRSC